MRRRCLGAWLTWMCLTIRLPVSRPLVSALASAFLSRPKRNSADLTGQRARETPNCFPAWGNECQRSVITHFMWSLILGLNASTFVSNSPFEHLASPLTSRDIASAIETHPERSSLCCRRTASSVQPLCG